jgi:photosystem II stability/assembly factor-like uncharacterized protein
MIKSRSFLSTALAVFALLLVGQGCLGTGSTPASGPDGGVWKTADRGKTWVSKRSLVSGATVNAAVANLSIVTMSLDPQDEKAIYLGTTENGILYTLDGGDSWRSAKPMSQGRVNFIAVDPKHKCTVYAVSTNKIYKTETCNRDWTQIFFDPRTDKVFTRIIVDWFNSTMVYAGTSEGDIFKSTDSGMTWKAIKRVEGTAITSLVMDPHDSRVIYAGTAGDGIWKTLDGGSTWLQIKKQFGEDFSDARRVTQIVVDPKNSNVIYEVSKYGIIKSTDQGETWKALNLIAPPGTITISAFAIDQTDNNKMIYTGPTTLAYSSDGGTSWTAQKLPTTRGGSSLIIDPKNGNTIYLGTQLLTK